MADDSIEPAPAVTSKSLTKYGNQASDFRKLYRVIGELCRGETESCLAFGTPGRDKRWPARYGNDYIKLFSKWYSCSILNTCEALGRMTPKDLYNQSYFYIHPVSG